MSDSSTTHLDPAWRTSGDPSVLVFEQLVNAAVYIGTVAFGVHVAIFASCSYHYLRHSKKFPFLQQLYITMLFLLAGTTIVCNIYHNQLTWIDYRDYPGGPGAFIFEQQGFVSNTIGNSAGLVLAFMVDSVLIYRCFVVWNSNFYVIILPILMLISSTVMAVLQTIAASQPSSALWSARAVQFGTPYFSLSMATNMLVTVIIVSRLLIARRQIQRVMGPKHGKEYTGVTALLIESAMPPALVSIVLIALYSQQIPAQVLFYPLLPQVQAMAPQLIFIRVMRGRAWNKQTLTSNVSKDVQFASNPSGTLTSRKGHGLSQEKGSTINIGASDSYESRV
ncbi:hypothetical protein FA15DRAFT_462916 [Coprinopsis marcescibilis]|uniref:Uncharacterized protein n=1 Tax=Coprinopsis marcescibilis TaxID=230819 RepID=A0A5C3KSU4_COPMA|nr:hypothetical protein FA15DRAFT_462916 [Coprinopsis marcescibilis]